MGRQAMRTVVREEFLVGWYLRVLEAGSVEAGQEMRLLERPRPELTVRRAAQLRRVRA